MNKKLEAIVGTSVVVIIFIVTFFYRDSIPKIPKFTNLWVNIAILIVIIIVGIVIGILSFKKDKRK